MPITVKEGLTRAGYDENGLNAEITYHVSGAEDEYQALTAEGIPEYGDPYPRDLGSGTTAARVSNLEATLTNGSDSGLNWTVTVKYSTGKVSGGSGGGAAGRPANPQPGDEWFSLSFTTETSHIQDARSQDAFGDNAPDAGLSIGLNDAGDVTGCDVLTPTGTLEIHHYLAPATITATWLANAMACLGAMNESTWYGLLPGDALFQGMSFGTQNDDVVEVVYSFGVRPFTAQEEIPEYIDAAGNQITVTNGKLGWQALWSWPMQKIEGGGSGGNTLSNCVRGVYVATVYPTNDFAALGLNNDMPAS
jgi:hypothetical protein